MKLPKTSDAELVACRALKHRRYRVASIKRHQGGDDSAVEGDHAHEYRFLASSSYANVYSFRHFSSSESAEPRASDTVVQRR